MQPVCWRVVTEILFLFSSYNHILYCWSNRNKCVRQLGESFISFNFNITSMTTNATKCQPLPLGLTLPTMLERHLSGWCPCKWRRLHRPGLQSKSTPSFGCLMKSCYGYPSRISSNIDNINCNCRYNYRMIKLKHSFVQLQTSLSGLHVPSHVLLENKWFFLLYNTIRKKTELHLPLRRLQWPCSNGFWWLLTPQPPIVHGTIAGSWYFGSTDSKHWCLGSEFFSKGWHPHFFLSVQVLLVRDSQFYSN